MNKEQNFNDNDLKALNLINEIYNEIYSLNSQNYSKEFINLYTAGIYFIFLLSSLNLQHSFLYELIKNRSVNDLDFLNLIFDFKLPVTYDESIQNIFENNRLINKIKSSSLKSNEKIRDLLIQGMKFDWSTLSPLIFNTLFENNLDYELKKIDGIHYTTESNIRKVLDPLFLDELTRRFSEAKSLEDKSRRAFLLDELINDINELKFLDPACGAGNFLIVTYLNLIKLEEEIKKILDRDFPVISINHFYGIELNESAAIIAEMGLQIAALYQTSLFNSELEVVSSYQIVNENALYCDWNKIVPKYELSYIIGNPPFLGARRMTIKQKKELSFVFGSETKNVGNLDYVSGWFKKASKFIKNSTIEVGFVSTTSVFQGQSVPILWSDLLKDIVINFAYESFLWEGNGKNTILVYVTAIGFSDRKIKKRKFIYSDNGKREVEFINGYLVDFEPIYPESRTIPLSNVKPLKIGNKPVDGGNLIFTKKKKEEFLIDEPQSEKFFKKFMGANDFINGRPRYCLFLKGIPIEEIMKYPKVNKQRRKVIEFRLESRSHSTRSIAEEPEKFHVENFPTTNYLVIPRHSSNFRDYLILDYFDKNVLAGDSLLVLDDDDLYYFGVLSSSLHKKWLEYVCGRLGNGFRYSKKIVYNNFPWPDVSEEEKEKVRKTAAKILEVRSRFPDKSLKTLYEPDSMPKELKQAHEENDRIVENLYGYSPGENIIEKLLNLYKKLTIENN